MSHRWWIYPLLVLSSVALAESRPNSKQPEPEQSSKILPVTTSSIAARRNFERAMRNFEEYRLNDSLRYLREATKQDPRFAQAFILIAKISRDPAEQAAARQRAKNLASKVSPGEQLLIRWLARDL